MAHLLRFARILLLAALFGLPAAHAEQPLIMGVFPRLNALETAQHFGPLARYLSEATGREVKLETAKDFESFWEGVSAQRYDLVHFNQYHYIKSHKAHGYQVILKNKEKDQSTLGAALVVRSDSPIQKLTDLKGKKVVFGGDRSAMQAYISTTYLLRKAGLKEGDYAEEFAKNPPNAVMGVFFRQADAAGAGDRVLEIPALAKRVNTTELRYLATGEQLAHLPWAVKSSMKPALRQQIQSTMQSMHTTELGKAILANLSFDGFVPATDKEYDKHRRIVREVLGEQY